MRPLFLSVMIILGSVCWAQTMRFSHLDQKQGLSQNTPTAFLQDRDGFLWVGTQDGLNRYDGYTFTVFRKIVNDTNSLCDNFILSLDEDVNGNIWIGTRNGLCVFVKSTGRVYRFYANENERKQYHANVRNVTALRDSGIVYLSYQGRLVFVTLRLVQNSPKFNYSILADSVNSIAYCESANQIAYQTGEEMRIGIPGQQPNTKLLLPKRTRGATCALLTEDALYINDSLVINKYDLTSSSGRVPLYESDSPVITMALDAGSNIWIGTNDGLRIVQSSGSKQVTIVKENPADFFSLKGDRVETIYMSDENLMWVGTVGAVNVYDPLQTRFSVLRGIFAEKGSDKPVWFVMSFADITMWSTDVGLNFTTTERKAPQWLLQIPAQFLYTAGCFDSNGRLWLGTKKEGVLIVDTINNSIDKRFVEGAEFSEAIVMDMICTRENKMWIASIGSLCTIDINTFKLTFITKAADQRHGISGTYFTSLEQDLSGSVYTASSNGLFRFDGTDTNYIQFRNNPANANSLCYNIINDIALINGELWIATMGSGLDRFNVVKNSFTHYTTSEGLANNTIYGIESSPDGKIWLSTNEGVIVLDPETGVSRNFTMRDGLPSNEFVINKHAQNSLNGDLYFGSAEGLVKLNPKDFSSAKSNAQPVITRLRVNYKDFPFGADSAIRLTPHERNINIEFTAIDFRNQDKISYAYKLEEFDTAWHSSDAINRNANFTNLPYGEYTFLVKYRVSGERWSEHILRMKIIIETPFYATWWFRIMIIVIGIVVVALIVRYISQRKLRKQLVELKMQEQIRSEKERISRDLHDNVGAQLTYVISSLDNLSYSLHKNPVTIKESDRLEELSGFARGTMDQLRESIWAINSEHISLSELAGRWKQYLSKLTESRAGLTTKVTRSGDDIVLKPTTAIEIHRIVQEAINNAFKHSGGTLIEIEAINSADEIEITIRDNGQGMDGQNSRAGHYGLRNMKERAEIAGGRLDIDSTENGTAVSVKIRHN